MELSDDLEPIPKIRNISYLYARDPSIVAYNRGDNIRHPKDLRHDLAAEDPVISSSTEKSKIETVQTFLRIKTVERDDHLYEIVDSETVECRIPVGSHAYRNVKDCNNVGKKYTFTKIFPSGSTQNELFCEIVKPKLLKFINGSNYSLLSYGASGSGKTYTIVGTAEEPGIIPRSLEYIFRTLPALSDEPKIGLKSNGTILRKSDRLLPLYNKSFRDNLLKTVTNLSEHFQHIRTYKEMQQRLSSEPVAFLDITAEVTLGVFVSFAEIYNEYIYDLLVPPKANRDKLPLGNCLGNCYIKNLNVIPVSNGLQAFQILQYGLKNLSYASTGINSHSSRSHCIFSIKLVQAADEGHNVSCFNFCDLAGSERIKKTMNVGKRLQESNNINTSLMVLSRCIKAVRESQRLKDTRLIPFRESKLTQLFKRALSGQEDISMIVNINPTRDMFDESYHVLNFSAIAREIVIDRPEVQLKTQKKRNRFSAYLENRSTSYGAMPEVDEDMYAEVERLKDIVSQLKYENVILNRQVQEVEDEARDEVARGFRELIEKKDAFHQRKIDELKAYHEEEIRRLKAAFATRSPRVETIDLCNSSSEDSLLEEKLQIIEELQGELDRCRAALEEKERTLEEAVGDYRGMQEEYEEEIVRLKKENIELKEELEIYKASKMQQSSEYEEEEEEEEG